MSDHDWRFERRALMHYLKQYHAQTYDAIEEDVRRGLHVAVYDEHLKDVGLWVVAAAICVPDGTVYSVLPPARHHDIIKAMHAQGRTATGPGYEQGFKLSDLSFCRRKPAKEIARRAGQLLARASLSEELFSEDVW